MLVAQLCPTLWDPMDCPWDFPGKDTGLGCHFLLQRIFPTQDQDQVSCTAGRFFTHWATREAPLWNKEYLKLTLGFPGSAVVKESTCQCRRRKRHDFDSWVGKILWSRKWQPTRLFLPGKSHGQKSLAGYSPGGHSQLDTTEHTHKIDI